MKTPSFLQKTSLVVLAIMLAATAASGEESKWEKPSASFSKGLKGYALPLDAAAVKKDFAAHLSGLGALNDEVAAALARNGFCVLQGPCGKSLYHLNYWLHDRGYPLYLTADAVSYLFHLQFDTALKETEENRLFPDLLAMLKGIYSGLAELKPATQFEKEAMRKAHAYVATALSLLGVKVQSEDAEVERTVKGELSLIEAASGFSPSPLFGYKEDYSQYKPRGHYTRSDKLKRYFKAVMWLGRPAFLVNGGKGKLVSEREARLQTAAALMLAQAAAAGNGEALDILGRMDRVLCFLVGSVENLSPSDYLKAMRSLSLTPAAMEDKKAFGALKKALDALPPPRIFSGLGKPITGNTAPAPGLLSILNENTRGMRLLGRRFTIDAFAFSKLVYPSVTRFKGKGEPLTGSPSRYLPSPFDFPALLSFERAASHAARLEHTAYDGYDEAFSMMRGAVSQHFSAPPSTAYDGLLKSLEALNDKTAFHLQPFQQTVAWKDRLLNTFLGSWATLKHDTVLYAQQSYPAEEGLRIPPKLVKPKINGYIEPEPEFFARMAALSGMLAAGLEAAGYGKQAKRFVSVRRFVERCLDVVKSEVEGKPFDENQRRFLDRLADICYRLEAVDPASDVEAAPIIADIATDPNAGKVLETGIGPFFPLLAIVALPDGGMELCAGPVFSFAAFTVPMKERMTDEKWRAENFFGPSPRLRLWLLSPEANALAGRLLKD